MVQWTEGFSGFAVPDLAAARTSYGELLRLETGEETGQLSLTLPGGAHVFVDEEPDHVPAVFTILNLVVADLRRQSTS